MDLREWVLKRVSEQPKISASDLVGKYLLKYFNEVERINISDSENEILCRELAEVFNDLRERGILYVERDTNNFLSRIRLTARGLEEIAERRKLEGDRELIEEIELEAKKRKLKN